MLKTLNRAALVLVTILFLVLSLGALTFQTAPPIRWICYALTGAVAVGVIGAGRKWGWLVLALGIAGAGLWYQTIQPRADRIWAEDVARGVTGVVHGDFVTLTNVRDFDWQTRDEAEVRWRDMTFDLREITSVDLFNSVWSSPLIAHTLIGFGFEDGRHLVFSAEIRREKGEVFSTFGGFFRQFELVMIAATESDIVRLRTTMRGEDVSLFPLRVSRDQARELFLSYITRANKLQAQPEFYNTLTSNCTTIIWELAHTFNRSLPFDWRVLVSGMLPEYLQDRGLLQVDAPIAEIRAAARISDLARQSDASGAAYSTVIRSGAVSSLLAAE